MTESQEPSTVTVDKFEQRTAFLKKAGLGAVGLGALWAVPRISTVKASSAYSAVTAPPCTVTKTFPAPNDVVPQLDVLFTWQPVPGAAQYMVQLWFSDTCANSDDQIGNEPTSTNSITFNFERSRFAGSTMSWKVIAQDATGNMLCMSECTNFSVEDIVP